MVRSRTNAKLEQRGIIQLARKQIVILDREGLMKAANGAYHEPVRSVSFAEACASVTVRELMRMRGWGFLDFNWKS